MATRNSKYYQKKGYTKGQLIFAKQYKVRGSVPEYRYQGYSSAYHATQVIMGTAPRKKPIRQINESVKRRNIPAHSRKINNGVFKSSTTVKAHTRGTSEKQLRFLRAQYYGGGGGKK